MKSELHINFACTLFSYRVLVPHSVLMLTFNAFRTTHSASRISYPSFLVKSNEVVIKYTFSEKGFIKTSINMATWQTCEAVERDPNKVSGAWVFQGTRVPVSALFENLKDGATIDQFLEWFPGVEREQVKTVLKHELNELSDPISS